ncbi:Uncharacterized protein BP5553_02474 [Venustampulla echinocandica]|uniref:Autophagy-related protein 14 n=1 Tax=Venustampulla echinocandica TaxID=2656787 RepID=A0A370U3Z6_9HELO|nr:Uncharacterized protein BP5553_02474 [Venustampulla echinocandica]RDL42495.1 Uncharacterized protein BP5553_02474 [Venustampulla echinocandica]
MDARNQLYEGRVQNARVLLENDSLQREVAALIPDSETEEQKDSSAASDNRHTVDAIFGERDEAVDRTQQIIAHADELRMKVEQARKEAATKKAHLARRKSDLASASNGAEARRARQLEDVEKSTRMTKYNWNKVHASHASSRTYLCGEAAKLYGLRRVKKSGGQEDYKIGPASPAQIATSLSHIVHLLVLSMHYLAIRLPAEITLPHRDYPLPTIFPLTSSYMYTDIPFPGSIAGQSSNTSPSASRHAEQANLPRPRPLFITKPLPILATEDPASYGRFLEGVTLLAYNIAWACKSQGIPVGEDSNFDDICNIGRNLYNLLIGPTKSHVTLTNRVPSRQPTPTRGGNRESDAEERKPHADALMGRYSHGTAHSFLGSAEGTEFIRSWKLLNPMKLADKLKARLMSEVANAEWEVLDQDAWTVDDEMGDDGVVVGARNEGGGRVTNLGMQSFMSMRTVMDAVEMVAGDGDKKPGTSGWTKLKPR